MPRETSLSYQKWSVPPTMAPGCDKALRGQTLNPRGLTPEPGRLILAERQDGVDAGRATGRDP